MGDIITPVIPGKITGDIRDTKSFEGEVLWGAFVANAPNFYDKIMEMSLVRDKKQSNCFRREIIY